tara:strand:- start:752 stop:1873 length:1122 start_codon:yes stop_codon:yes gene_type:complete
MFMLHSGLRRFSCDGKFVPKNQVPYVQINEDMDEITVLEAELEENLIREDITWQERLASIDKLHRLRVAQHPDQTVTDTAREIKQVGADAPAAAQTSIAHTRKEVARATIIAPFLDDPDVKAASSASRAFALVAVKLEAEFMAELERRGGGKKTDHTLIHGKLEEEMPKLQDDTYTCIIADPPYGMGADKFGDVAELVHKYVDDGVTAADMVAQIAIEGFRVAKKEAHLYIFCDIDLFVSIRALVQAAGWTPWRTPIIWDKGDGYAPQQSSGMKRCYELILWARKGGKPYGQAHKDIIPIPPAPKPVHAAQKPMKLYSELLKRSCLMGDKVLDPCCGAGTIFAASVAAGTIATGIEADAEFLDHARMRMREDE